MGDRCALRNPDRGVVDMEEAGKIGVEVSGAIGVGGSLSLALRSESLNAVHRSMPK